MTPVCSLLSAFRSAVAVAVAALGVQLAVPAAAQAATLFVISGLNEVCVVSFRQTGPAVGLIDAQPGCGRQLSQLRGWRNDRPGGYALYAADGRTLLGRLDQRSDGTYSGSYGRAAIRMAGSAAPQATPPRPARQSGCLTYIHNGQCARPSEAQERGLAADQIQRRTLARLNLRFFPGTDQIKVGEMQAGTCVSVGRCQTHRDGQLWCETRAPSGGTAWYLQRSSAGEIFSSEGCS